MESTHQSHNYNEGLRRLSVATRQMEQGQGSWQKMTPGQLQEMKEVYLILIDAANGGYADAQLNLGIIHGEGRGVKQDHKEAARWHHNAAEQGHAEAQFNMGIMHANGRGVQQDNKEAARWYRKSAEQGHEKARAALRFIATDNK